MDGSTLRLGEPDDVDDDEHYAENDDDDPPPATTLSSMAGSTLCLGEPDDEPVADCPAMSFVFVFRHMNIRNRNQLSWAIN